MLGCTTEPLSLRFSLAEPIGAMLAPSFLMAMAGVLLVGEGSVLAEVELLVDDVGLEAEGAMMDCGLGARLDGLMARPGRMAGGLWIGMAGRGASVWGEDDAMLLGE